MSKTITLENKNEIVKKFLEGLSDEKYVTNIECDYYSNIAYLIIDHPEHGKLIKKQRFKPFMWVKEDVFRELYGGNNIKIKKALKKYGLKVRKLKYKNDDTPDEKVPERLLNSYKYIIHTTNSFNDIISFFSEGGVSIYKKENKNKFYYLHPTEQFMLQKGIRLFKGFNDYEDVHKLVFDIETEGLNPEKHRITKIGMYDNRGVKKVITVKSKTYHKIYFEEKREPTDEERKIINDELYKSEAIAIVKFFKYISEIKPSIIAGYNSENFDFYFMIERSKHLGFDLTKYVSGLKKGTTLIRKPSYLKIGEEVERYEKTILFGYSIIDTIHAVRRAQSIDRKIKKNNLKYITKYSKINKENRVYIKGDKINKILYSRNKFYFNNENGDWFEYDENNEEHINKINSGKYKEVNGEYIVNRYLIDDLWETMEVDNIYNKASYHISKIIPTTFQTATTSGTAAIWKLIMTSWSYYNNLAIPDFGEKKSFVGGLSRLLKVGFERNVVKFDYAALYPKTEITYNIKSEYDFTNAMIMFLEYVVDERDELKFLKEDLKSRLNEFDDKEKVLKKIQEISKEEMPIKILANSFFGSFGAPYIFPWGDIKAAEETTCRGRQLLRLMVKYMMSKGFEPLVGDSVTGETPVYIRYKDTMMVNILPIKELFNDDYIDINGQQRDFSPKNYQILTKNGWKDIKYIYRHKTNKKIYRINTKHGFIECTSDHSLFSNNIEIKPTNLSYGDKIDTINFDLPKNGIKVMESFARLNGYFIGIGDFKIEKISEAILNSDINTKKIFLEGFAKGYNGSDSIDNINEISHKSYQLICALNLLLRDVGYDVDVIFDSDNENFVLKIYKRNKIDNEENNILEDYVVNIEIKDSYDDYVYDISADGTFIAGIGNIVAHNTDGFNFKIPENIDEYKYVVKGSHWKTKKYPPNTVVNGIEAVLCEFNEKYMIGRLGLDIDEYIDSTINFARKNYAYKKGDDITIVGNTFSSKTIPTYIENFIKNGISLLLDGKGYEFIEYYYDYVEKIFNMEIPISEIATKKRVKQTVEDYINIYTKERTKTGILKSRQAHMELLIKHKIKKDLGDTVYYVNTSDNKNAGDVTVKKNKNGEIEDIILNCVYIDEKDLENGNSKKIKYNVSKYIDALNKRIKRMLVVFNEDIRDNILISVKKDRKTGKLFLEERSYFTKKECELVSGYPIKPSDQDNLDDLLKMSDDEIEFWVNVNKIPNNIDEIEFDKIVEDWKIRNEKKKKQSILNEKEMLFNIIKRLEYDDLVKIKKSGNLPKKILTFLDIKEFNNEYYFYSKKWGVKIAPLKSIFKYKKTALFRKGWYKNNWVKFSLNNNNKFDIWFQEMSKLGKDVFLEGNDNINCGNENCGYDGKTCYCLKDNEV
jgi:DNA polymerase elongation subunit (family B)